MFALARDFLAHIIHVRNGIKSRIFVLVGKLEFDFDGFVDLVGVRIVNENGDCALLRLCLVGAEREERLYLLGAELGQSVTCDSLRIFADGFNCRAGENIVTFFQSYKARFQACDEFSSCASCLCSNLYNAGSLCRHNPEPARRTF